MVDRVNFSRRYDLPERVHAPEVLEARPLDSDEAQLELLALAGAALGIATAHDLAGHRQPVLQRRAVGGVGLGQQFGDLLSSINCICAVAWPWLPALCLLAWARILVPSSASVTSPTRSTRTRAAVSITW